MLKFALKNAFRKKGIASLAIIGIGLGIMLMVILGSTTENMGDQVDEAIQERVGIVSVREKGRTLAYQSSLSKNITLVAQNSPDADNIVSMTPETYLPPTTTNYSEILPITEQGVPPSIDIVGTDPAQLFDLHPEVTEVSEGRIFENSGFEAVVPYALAEAKPKFFGIDQVIPLQINSSFSFDLTIVGIYHSEMEENPHSPEAVKFSIFSNNKALNTVWQELARPTNAPFHFLPANTNPEQYNLLVLRYDSTDLKTTQGFAGRLQLFLDESLTTQHMAYVYGEAGIALEDLREQISTFLMIVSLISVLSGSMSIIIAQLIGLEQRLKEFAILKATGWKGRHLLFDLLIESSVLALTGALVGIVHGVIGLHSLEHLMGTSNGNVALSISVVGQALFLALLLGIFGGLYPAIKAANVRPIQVLRGQ
ncbi:MAG: ABC transporter permease [Candidatus Heimdallarchaeota archaeon]